MKLSEIKKLKSGVYTYSTRELVQFLNNEHPNLGSNLYRQGFFDVTGNQDSILYNIEQEIENVLGHTPPFSITDIQETDTGRIWHVIDMN